MKTFASLATLALLSLLPTPATRAQNPPPAAGFEGLVEVTEVLIDVLATDRDGQPVLGLGAEDFEVFENGRPVRLTGVSFYSTRYAPDGSVLGDDDVPSSRYFIFFLHDQSRTGAFGTRLTSRLFDAARQCHRWTEEEMKPGDWVAVLSYDVKLKLHQDFTQDRGALAYALEAAAIGKDPEDLAPSKRPRPPAGGAASLGRHLPEGKQLRKETGDVHDALRLVAEAAGYTVGRKNLVLFTLGFGRVDGFSRLSRPDPRYYPQLEQALNDHNVAIYPIDLTPELFERQQRDFLGELAADTGGRYYENAVSLLTPLLQTSEENVGYYLLSYRSEHPAGEVGYQEVTVKPRDSKIRLKARQGYRYGT